MRGTLYAAAEIVWWLLAAAAIGFLLGWVVHRWRVRKVEAEWSGRLDRERKRAGKLDAALESRTSEAEGLSSQLAEATERLKELEAEAASLPPLGDAPAGDSGDSEPQNPQVELPFDRE